MTPSEEEFVLIPKAEYDLLKTVAVGLKGEVESVKDAIEREKRLRREYEEKVDALAVKVLIPDKSGSRPMTAYVDLMRQDFKLNNYTPRSWKSFIPTSRKTGKPMKRNSKSYLKDAMERSGDFEFYIDNRDRRRLMVRFIGRKL